MDTILLAPPVAFFIYLLLSMGVSFFSKRIAAKGTDAPGKTRAYSCGENMPENQGQPEYTEFFQFAFFFTIIHVIVLVVATEPMGISVMSAVYLGVTVLALFMLFRRKKDVNGR